MGRKQRLKQEKTEIPKSISRDITKKGTLYYIVYLGLIVLLLYPPYLRGLFFDREFLPTHIFSGILFLLWVIYKGTVLKEHRFLRTPMDYAALALVGAYFISVFIAANPRSAVGELLKYMNYFIAYYLVSDIARTKKDITIILSAMVLSAVGVAFVGIGAAAGTFTYNGAFVGGRINSTLQYPNTLAAYLTAAFMISTTLWVIAKERWQRAILSVINYTFILCFIFTLSRAAWLMYPVFYLIYIVGMPGEYRLKALGYSFQTFVAALIASPGFGSAISGDQGTAAWKWYAVGAFVAVGLFYIVERMGERFSFNIKPRAVAVTLVIVTLLIGIGGYIAFSLEAPLTLSHGPDEKESWKTLWYEAEEIEPDTEYTLKLTVSAKPGREEEHWGGVVIIRSVDENQVSAWLHEEFLNGELSQETLEIPIKTRADSRKLSIGLSNYHPNTSATFGDVNLYMDNSLVKHFTLGYKYIPEAISSRIDNINFSEQSFVERFVFYKDALKIVKDHPLLGVGGGGWNAVYKAYQSYRYFTTEVHSFFLQVWVETGTLGMIALVALWLTSLGIGYKIFRTDVDVSNKVFAWGALSGALALGGHSAVDFNLSLGSVALYLWQLFGLVKATGVLSMLDVVEKGKRLFAAWSFGAVICLFIAISTLFYQGYSYGQQAISYIEEQDLMKAREAFQKAAKYDPITASFRADLAQLDYIVGSQTDNQKLLEKADKERAMSVKLDPYNTTLQSMMASQHMAQGDLQQAMTVYEEITRLNPYNIQAWEDLAQLYEKAMEISILADKKEDALGLSQKALGIFDQIKELNIITPKSAREKLEVTNSLMLNIYKTKLLAKNIDDKAYVKKLEKLVFASDFTVDADNNGTPDLWRYSNSEKGLLKIQSSDEAITLLNGGEGPSYLSTIEDIALNPDENYTIKTFIDGEKYRLNIFSRAGKSPQHQIKDFETTNGIAEIKSSLTTTEDIEGSKQWLRFDFDGGSEAKLQVLEIWED